MSQNKNENGIDVDTDMKITCESMGKKINMDMTGNLKMQSKGSDPESMQGNMQMKLFNQEVSFAYYYKDGVMYIKSNENKVKVSIDADKAFSKAGLDEIKNSLYADYEKCAFENAKIEKDGGITTVITTLPADAVNSLVDNLTKRLGTANKSAKPAFESITMILSVNGNGDLVAMKISFSASFSEEATQTEPQKMDMDAAIKYTVNNPGKPVTITPPSDLNSYIDASGIPDTASDVDIKI